MRLSVFFDQYIGAEIFPRFPTSRCLLQRARERLCRSKALKHYTHVIIRLQLSHVDQIIDSDRRRDRSRRKTPQTEFLTDHMDQCRKISAFRGPGNETEPGPH